MKVYTTKEVINLIHENEYKLVCLMDQAGSKILPFNRVGTDPAGRLSEIEKKLTNEITPDGIYVICCKHAQKSKPDNYYVRKGSEKSAQDPTPVIIQQPAAPGPDVITYDAALKMQVENERLKMQVEQLTAENEQLTAQLEELETEMLAEDPTNELIENGKTFLTETLATIAPLLDKHFELKEKQLALTALQYQQRPQERPASIERPEHRAPKKDIESYIMSCKEDPDKYNELAAIYNGAENEDDFLKQLAENSQEDYIKLLQWINN
jgi:hypothetical protein